MKLKDLIEQSQLIKKLYEQVTDFDRNLQIMPVIDDIEKHLQAYDKALAGLKEKHKDEPQQAEAEFQKLLEKDVKVNIVKVTKDEAKAAKLNPFQLRLVIQYVEK